MKTSPLLDNRQFLPDFEGLRATILREHPPNRVYHAELFLDDESKDSLAGLLDIDVPSRAATVEDRLRREARLCAALGMDIVRIHLPDSEFTMERPWDKAAASAMLTGQGYRVHEHAGPIQSEEDLERYPWPRVSHLDFSLLEWAENHLPEGMKGYDLSAQFLECSTWLLGYENFFVSIHEEPEFLAEVLRRVSEFYLGYIAALCDFDSIGAIWAADDMGFKAQTMVAPDWLRKHILPLHREAARIAHDHGKLYLLHSCGKVEVLMKDIVEFVGADGKHSYEDVIDPVEQIHARWGDRIGIIGGIDVDLLARGTEEDVVRRTLQVLEACHHKGGYVLGSGNSITNYVKPENYLAMLREGRRFL